MHKVETQQLICENQINVFNNFEIQGSSESDYFEVSLLGKIWLVILKQRFIKILGNFMNEF